eukprot:6213498-Pleurochrysis_carterae.AAC.4
MMSNRHSNVRSSAFHAASVPLLLRLGVVLLVLMSVPTVANDGKNKRKMALEHPNSPELAANELAAAAGLPSLQRLIRDGGRFEERHRKEGLHLWYTTELPADESATLMTAAGKHSDMIEKIALLPDKKMHAVPSDPLYSLQEHFKAINMEAAWERSTGNPNVVVAIMDSGADVAHPDLFS